MHCHVRCAFTRMCICFCPCMLIHASLDPHYRNWPDMRPTYLQIPTFPGIDFSSAPHIFVWCFEKNTNAIFESAFQTLESVKWNIEDACLLALPGEQPRITIHLWWVSWEYPMPYYNVLQCFPTSLSCLERASWAITQSLNFKKRWGFNARFWVRKAGKRTNYENCKIKTTP